MTGERISSIGIAIEKASLGEKQFALVVKVFYKFVFLYSPIIFVVAKKLH